LNRLRKVLQRYREERPFEAKIVSNMTWLLFEKGFRLGIGFIIGIWFARYLGVDQLGRFNYALALISLFSAFTSLGLNTIVVRDLVKLPEKISTTLGSTFLLQTASSLLAFLFAILFTFWMFPDDALSRALVIILGLGLTTKCSEVIRYWFESQTSSKHIVKIDNLVFLLASATKALFIIQERPLIAFAWIAVIQSALAGFCYFGIYAKEALHPLATWKPQFKRSKELLRDSWPLFLSGIAVMLYMRIDQVMLGKIQGSTAVGHYSIAVTWTELWLIIPIAIAQSAFPRLAEIHRDKDTRLFNFRYQQLTNRFIAIATLSIIATLLLASPLIKFLYGEQYSHSVSIIKVYIFSNLIVYNGILASKWITLKNLQKLILLKTSAGALINIALNLLLIPCYGTLGAAYSTLISYTASGLLFNFLFKAMRPLAIIHLKSILIVLFTPHKLFKA